MLGNLLGSLVDKEQIVRDTIQSTLENLADELHCQHNELFIMIKPIDSDFNMIFHVYKMVEGVPKPIREIPLTEILNT
jgi:hypothetical protein